MSSGISFSGLGSGLDTETIVSQLMAIERRPLNKLEDRREAKNQALTIYSDLRSKLNELKTQVASMNTVREFNKMAVTSSDEDVFTVSADNTASAGSHTIKVNQLALAEMEVSQGYATASSAVGTGTFSITVGSEDAVEITIDDNHNSLTGMVEAINSADVGVTATIMNDGDSSNPYRIVVTSDETGTANALTIDVSGLSGGTAPIFTDGSGGTPGQQAVDALLTFDGVSVVKSSNEIDDLLTGVTIDLHEVDTENTLDLVIESNTEEIMTNIQDFVTKYNEIYDYLENKSSTDAVKGDYTFSSIKRAISSIVTGGVDDASGDFTYLSQAGITTDANGHLSVDTEDLEDALEDNFDDVMQLFTSYATPDNPNLVFHSVGSNTVSGTYDISITGIGESFAATINGEAASVSETGNLIYGASGSDAEGLMLEFIGSSIGDYGSVNVSLGIMEQLERAISNYTDVSDGMIKNKEESIRNSITSLDRRIEQEELQMDKIEARMKAKFTKMETQLSQLQTQSSYLGTLGS